MTAGRPRKWRRARNVLYALERRECPNPSPLTCNPSPTYLAIMTVGMKWEMMEDVMQWLRPAYNRCSLTRSVHDIRLNAHIQEFMTLELTDRDERFCSDKDIALLFEARVKAICKRTNTTLTIKRVSVEKLINT